jgi:chloramphenicol-sensitive protein RarD
MDASIGYYIFPLLAVSVGFILFGERLTGPQWSAVALALIAVLTLTIGLGAAPWLSISLAGFFAIYGAFKRGVRAGPILSVTAEVAIVGPLSLIWILGVHLAGWTDFTGRSGGFFGHDPFATALFIFSGFVTAVPLMLFSYAARRIKYSTIGLLQYINPTIQFLLAVWYFGQQVTPYHAIALPLIWVGLTIYSVSALRHDNASRKVSEAQSE